MEIASSIGRCVKDSQQIVQEQNQLCTELCGNMMGQCCEKGCMKAFAEIPQADLFKIGFHHFRNLELDSGRADAVVLFDGSQLTTELFPLSRINEEKLRLLSEHRLSNAEINVMRLMLEGLSNQQIADRLFISKTTLKTHINNIYKKIPRQLRPSRS